MKAGQLPGQPGVDRPEHQLAGLGPGLGAGHIVEQPAQLEAREVGGQGQPGLAAQLVLPAACGMRGNQIGSAGVHPDQRIVDWLTARLVPQQGGFALVGNPDRGQITCRKSGLGQGTGNHRLGVGPDLGRVVLDPAGLGHDLGMFLLIDRDNFAAVAEHDEARAGRPLVDRTDVA